MLIMRFVIKFKLGNLSCYNRDGGLGVDSSSDTHMLVSSVASFRPIPSFTSGSACPLQTRDPGGAAGAALRP